MVVERHAVELTRQHLVSGGRADEGVAHAAVAELRHADHVGASAQGRLDDVDLVGVRVGVGIGVGAGVGVMVGVRVRV